MTSYLFSFSKYFSDVYTKPYCRIPPYVMGIVLGYVICKYFSKRFQLKWVRRLLIEVYSTGAVHLEDVNIIVNICKILAKSHYKLSRIQ